MKNFFKNWNLFEKMFLISSLLVITICFLFTNDKSIITLLTSIFGILTVLCGAKGLIVAPIINIIYNVVYTIISISEHYYGEAIIYIFLMMPINIITIVSWLKNKSKENKNIVKVNKIKTKEYICLFITTILLTIGFYFLLKVLNTNELIISTISLVTSIIASYLMLRRSSNYAIVYILNDIILITLWSISVKNNGAKYIPIVITFIVFFINDIYGFISWKKREKNQK